MDDQNIFRRIDPANRPIQLIMGLCLLAYAFSGPFLPTQGVAWAVINLLEAVCIYSAVNLYRKMYGRLSPWLYVGIAAAIWCGLMLCAFRGWAPAAEPCPGAGSGANLCVPVCRTPGKPGGSGEQGDPAGRGGLPPVLCAAGAPCLSSGVERD